MSQFRFKKNLYSKEALIKAAYEFIDDFYIHLDSSDEEYIVTVDCKKESNELQEKEFQNELLIQETRRIIAERTGNLREIMYARAMASTIIEDVPPEITEDEFDAEDILTDWFEKYGE